jgi:hypothetical protein
VIPQRTIDVLELFAERPNMTSREAWDIWNWRPIRARAYGIHIFKCAGSAALILQMACNRRRSRERLLLRRQVGLCQVCAAPRINKTRCAACRDNHRDAMRMKRTAAAS